MTSPRPTPVAPGARRQSAFFRDVVRTVAGNLASPLVGLATAPVLAHSLGVEGRGQFAAATAPTLLLTVAGTVGLPEAATYFIASARLGARTTLRWVATLSTVVGVLLVCLIAPLAQVLAGGDPFVGKLLLWGACSLPAALTVAALRGVAAGRGRWTMVNASKYVENGLRLTLVVAFALTDWLSLWTAVAIYLGCPVLAGVVYLPLLTEGRTPRPPAPAARTGVLLLRYGGATWVGGLTGVVLSRLDQVLLSPLGGAKELGLYAAAVAIGEVPHVVSGATRDVLLAADATGSNNGRAERATRMTLLATAALVAVMGLCAPLLVQVAFGREFSGSVEILQLLLVAALLYAPGSTVGAAMMARGRPGPRSLALGVACAVNVVALVFLVPEFGGVGAAWASVASCSVFSLCTLVSARVLFHMSVRSMVLPILSDLTMLPWRGGASREGGRARRDPRTGP